MRPSALRVGDDHRPLDAEQVGREHERPEDVVGDAGARIPHDLCVARLEPQHRERLDPGVDAREHRETPGRARLEPGEPEIARIRRIGGEHVVERPVVGHGAS